MTTCEICVGSGRDYLGRPCRRCNSLGSQTHVAQRGRLTHRECIVALDKYLTDLHSATWGETYTITSEDRREAAIDWFVDVCEKIGLLQTEGT